MSERSIPMHVVLWVALVACGSKQPASSGTASTTGAPSSGAAGEPAQSTEPLPPVTQVGDACRLSKDCSPLGAHHKCMRTGSTAACYPTPMKTCDEPSCDCFNNDPCVANDLGTCTGYETGVVICTK